MLRLEHQTLNDRAYGALKQGLISGRFRPGQVLVIRKLAEGFGISTTPIREALQRLVAERLLEVQQNRSIAVPVLSVKTFGELVRIRCTVEGLAGEMAARKIDGRQIDQMRRKLAGMDEAIASRNGRRYLALNERFHFAIYAQAGAPILLEMIRDLWGRVGPYMTYLIELDAYIPRSNDLHKKIVSALEEGNARSTRTQIVRDIASAAKVLLPCLAP